MIWQCEVELSWCLWSVVNCLVSRRVSRLQFVAAVVRLPLSSSTFLSAPQYNSVRSVLPTWRQSPAPPLSWYRAVLSIAGSDGGENQGTDFPFLHAVLLVPVTTVFYQSIIGEMKTVGNDVSCPRNCFCLQHAEYDIYRWWWWWWWWWWDTLYGFEISFGISLSWI